MIKILIADNQWLFRYGIKSLLKNGNDFEVIGSAKSVQELLEKTEANSPDLLLMDPDAIAGFSFDKIKTIQDKHANLKICVITANKDKDFILNILKQGIKNVITKDCNAEEFYNALRATYQDEKYFSNFILEILLENQLLPAKTTPQVQLTQKEIEIIRLLAQGLTTKDIANKIFISFHTVNTHRKNILAKLQLRNSSELVMYAMKNGLLDTIEYYI